MAAIKAMTKRPMLLALLMLAAPLAQAMPAGGRFLQVRDGFRQHAPQRERQQPAPERQYDQPQRFQRRDEGNAGEQDRRQRLSPEERRQLRRDIHDAGRDIYRR